MKKKEKTKGELLKDIALLQKRVKELEEAVTEGRQAEEASRVSEASYRAIFDTANDGIFIHDIETGRILDANKRGCELLGYSPEEFRQMDVGTLGSGEPPYTQEYAMQRMKDASDGKPQLIEWRARHKNGRLFWLEVNLNRAKMGGKDCLLAIVSDITDGKRGAAAVRNLTSR